MPIDFRMKAIEVLLLFHLLQNLRYLKLVILTFNAAHLSIANIAKLLFLPFTYYQDHHWAANNCYCTDKQL